MCDSLARKRSICHLHQPQSNFQKVLAFVPLLILGFVSLNIGATAQAASPDTAPTALTETITQIDAAANQHDLQAVMRFYDRQFTHSDGLTYTPHPPLLYSKRYLTCGNVTPTSPIRLL
jgi:hypothetical protein